MVTIPVRSANLVAPYLAGALLVLLEDVCFLHVLLEDAEPTLEFSLAGIYFVVLLHEALESTHVTEVMGSTEDFLLRERGPSIHCRKVILL